MATATASTVVRASVSLYPATVQSILTGADECTVTVGLECGYKTAPNGNTNPVYASVRVACKEGTLDDALKALEALGVNPIKVSIPKVTTGRLTLQLAPIMGAAKFAALCRADS